VPIVTWTPQRVIAPIEAAFKPAAEGLEKVAQGLAPVRTGRLQASISFQQTGPTSGVLRASAPYAGYVEYGTNDTRAQPFLEQAAPTFPPQFISLARGLLHLGF